MPVRPRSPAPKSDRRDLHRGVEQLVARRAHNPEVEGSSPSPATKKGGQKRRPAKKSDSVGLFSHFQGSKKQDDFIDAKRRKAATSWKGAGTMPNGEKKGIAVRIDADLHAEVSRYLKAHNMTMAEFVMLALDDKLPPRMKILHPFAGCGYSNSLRKNTRRACKAVRRAVYLCFPRGFFGTFEMLMVFQEKQAWDLPSRRSLPSSFSADRTPSAGLRRATPKTQREVCKTFL